MASLNVLQPSPAGSRIKPSRASGKRLGVLVLVHAAIAAHITHWLTTGRSLTPLEPSEAAAFSHSGVVNAGLVFFAITAVLTAVLGRFFCGWGCHVVALQDLSSGILARLGIRPKPLRSRTLTWVPTLAFFAMFVWPAIQRWQRDRLSVHATEWTTEYFWQTFPSWFVGGLTFFVCGFAIVYLLGAKGFCTYACPYGALFGAVDRLAPMRIRVNENCEGCGHCTAVCTSNVRVHQEVRDFGMVVSAGCMKCLDCVSVCPKQALRYGPGRPALFAASLTEQPKENPKLPWRDEAVLVLGFVTGYLCVRGAYGATPLLLSLGLSCCVAFATRVLVQLVTEPNVRFLRTQLKAGNGLLKGGYVALLCLLILAAALGHTAWLKQELRSGDRIYRSLSSVITARRAAVADPQVEVRPLSSQEASAARQALQHYQRIASFGISPGVGPVPRSAWLHYLLDNASAARQAADRAVLRNELPWAMHELVGHLAAERGDWTAAQTAYLDEYRLRPSRSAAVRLAGAATYAGTPESGAATLLETERLFGVHPDTSFALGVVRASQGDFASARKRFQEVLEQHPAHLPAMENLAGIEAQTGNLAEARRLFAQALEIQESAETRFLLVRVLLELGDSHGARKEIEPLLALKPVPGPVASLAAEIDRGHTE